MSEPYAVDLMTTKELQETVEKLRLRIEFLQEKPEGIQELVKLLQEIKAEYVRELVKRGAR
jgi:hypothetical protein